MAYAYAPDALVYNAGSNSWSLKPGYDHTVDRVEINIWDDDGYLDGDRSANEVGEDSNQYGEVRDMGGNLTASGTIYDEYYYEVAKPGGGSIYLEQIEIGGVHVGWLVTEPLVEGQNYTEIGSGDVDDNIGGDDDEGGVDTTLLYSDIASVPCFGAGTMIATEEGALPIDWIRPGDMVLTRDNGYQPVLWVGRCDLAEETADDDLRLIEINTNAFGDALPERTLRVTANHRVLLHSHVLDLHFGSCEMFAAAKHLVDGKRIVQPETPDRTVVYHLLLSDHEVILAEGLWVESLLASEAVLRGQPGATQLKFEKWKGDRHRLTARPCLRAWEIEMFDLPTLIEEGRVAA